jgi:hypothetical protein
MSIEKTLQKLRGQLEVLSDEMKNFSEPGIHPTVADVEKLQSILHDILESTAVFKFQKASSEISPSFNIHAKVSEKTEEIAHVVTTVNEQLPVPPAPADNFEPQVEKPQEVSKEVGAAQIEAKVVEQTPTITKKQLAALSIGLNDKFRFINELFLQNAPEYNIVLEQLSTLQSWTDADIYINSLKNVYSWKDSNETFKYFCSVVRKRYDA